MEEQSFYMIIPATVYDAEIKDKAKLLYGHITSLCRQKGYCWATNEHLAKLVKVDSKSTASSYVSDLVKLGVIKTHLIYAEDQKTVKERRIYLADSLIGINQNDNSPINQNVNSPIVQTSKDNTITNNNITNNSISGDEKLLNKIIETYPGNINAKAPLLKALKSLSKEEKILAVKNIERYKKAANGFYLNLRNYIESKAFSEVELKKKEDINKLKNQKQNDTTNNASTFTNRDADFY